VMTARTVRLLMICRITDRRIQASPVGDKGMLLVLARIVRLIAVLVKALIK
jgi:hypothetical protein